MPNINGGDQEDPNWANPAPKFDFEQIDVKLYLALKAVLNPTLNAHDGQKAEEQASLAMQEFELDKGPLPDWAIDRNWFRELVPGAQLCTKDGRRMGNAHIILLDDSKAGQVYYVCLTDAGSVFTLSESEVNTAFWIGEWVSDPNRVIKDFDRDGHFTVE